MSTAPFLLIDYSSIAHAVFHISGNEPDPSFIATTIVARIRALAADYPHAALCCDSGKSFRREMEPTYKAQRDTGNRAVLKVQMDAALERLKTEDGFPVWASDTFEGDDVIATAVREILALDDEAQVHIATADKDLFQLVTERVSVKRTIDKGGTFTPSGVVVTPTMVLEKYGVTPSQMLDYLALVGDTSDNVKGADGIGPKNAAELLAKHGTLDAIFAAFDAGATPHITSAKRTALQNFRPRAGLVRDLIRLRDDAPGLAIAEIGVEREGKAMEDETEPLGPDSFGGTDDESHYMAQTSAAKLRAEIDPKGEPLDMDKARERAREGLADLSAAEARKRVAGVQAMVPAPPIMAPLVPRDYSQELEPRTLEEAKSVSKILFDSRHFGAYGTPQAVLATVMAGRELGLGALTALRSFHIVKGKPQMSADLMAALVLRSGKAKYFRCAERTDTRCTFVTQRLPVEDYPEQSLTYTIEQARKEWKDDQRAWDNSGWGKTPAAMLVAACKRTLARLEYPDVVGNIYDEDEVR